MEKDQKYPIIDKDNEFLPNWIFFQFTPSDIYIIMILLCIFWYFIFYKQLFKYGSSIIFGALVGLITLTYYYLLAISFFGIIAGDTTTKRWKWSGMMPIGEGSERGPDRGTVWIGDIGNYMTQDKREYGLIATKEFRDKIGAKKTNITDLFSGICRICTDKKTDTIKKNTAFTMRMLSRDVYTQGYYLLTMLFTVVMLVWHIDKPMFKKIVFPLFKYASITCVAILLMMTVVYEAIGDTLEQKIKNTSLIFSVSITSAIIAEVFNTYAK